MRLRAAGLWRKSASRAGLPGIAWTADCRREIVEKGQGVSGRILGGQPNRPAHLPDRVGPTSEGGSRDSPYLPDPLPVATADLAAGPKERTRRPPLPSCEPLTIFSRLLGVLTAPDYGLHTVDARYSDVAHCVNR